MLSIKQTDEQPAENNKGTKKSSLPLTPRQYDALVEYQRMGAIQPRKASCGSSQQFPNPWRPFLKVNSTYNVCQSYSYIIFGPSSINDGIPEGLRIIRQTAAFRCGGRMQALSWASSCDGASLLILQMR